MKKSKGKQLFDMLVKSVRKTFSEPAEPFLVESLLECQHRYPKNYHDLLPWFKRQPENNYLEKVDESSRKI